MASPALDGNAGAVQTTTVSTNSTKALPTGITTSTANDLILVSVYYCSTTGTPSVSSVTSAHLTFTKRKAFTNGNAGNHNVTIERWEAQASGTLSGEIITVNWTSNIDDACIIAAAFAGANVSNPFDANGSLPGTAANSTSTTPPSITFSTNKPDDLILFDSCQSTNIGTLPGTPTGYSSVASVSNTGGVNQCLARLSTKSVSSIQSSASVVDSSGTSLTSWTAMVDAITSDTAGETGTGVMAFGGIAFSGAGAAVVTGMGAMAFGPAAMTGLGADLGPTPSHTPKGLSTLTSQQLQPLTWNVSLVYPENGFPTVEFQRKWLRQFNIIKQQLIIDKSIVTKSYVDAMDLGVLNAAQQFTQNNFANPSAVAGPVAINGVAKTAMRSDSAPPVQKASATQFGIVEVDGTTIGAVAGVISAILGSTQLADFSTGTWTPVDASGASLVFTSTAGQYIRIGKLMILEFNVVYPTTADGSTTAISGFPGAWLTPATFKPTFLVNNNIGLGAPVAVTVANSGNISIINASTTANLTNAQMSTSKIYGLMIGFTS